MIRGGAPSQTPAATSLFRRLVWEGTVPLEIKVDGKELPAGSDRGLECYYIQAPRISYLPLLIPDIKKHLIDVILDEASSALIKEDDWWFEETERGGLMKWHWPIGLLYDYNLISQGLHSTSTSYGSSLPTEPLRLTLHLTSPPLDKLLLTPSAETCKLSYMGQLKEADFLRWGSTKRVTGLRKQDHDGLWEGVRSHNFEDFWRIGSKIFPTTTPLSAHSSNNPNGASTMNSPPPTLIPPNLTNNSTLVPSRPPSADPAGQPIADRDGAYTVRSVPVRIFLPDGPVLQELVQPVIEEGRAHTLRHFLRTHLPLLFPPPPSQPQAYAILQGVVVPGDAEMAWLGACMAGADGWVNVCIGLGKPPR